MRQTLFDGNRNALYYAPSFSIPETLGVAERLPDEFFRFFQAKTVSHSLSIPETFTKIATEPPQEIFIGDKKFSTSFCDTPSMFHQSF